MRFPLVALLVLSGTAAAAPRRVIVDTPVETFQSAGATPSYLYLNRCSGGCGMPSTLA